MVLEIEKRGLEIYLTGPDVGWDKDPLLKYSEEPEGYRLFGVRKDAVGDEFKHFVVCSADVRERRRIEGILRNAGYAVTGEGSEDDEPGRWRIWFLRPDYPTTKGYEHPYSNNQW